MYENAICGLHQYVVSKTFGIMISNLWKVKNKEKVSEFSSYFRVANKIYLMLLK